MPRLRLPLLGLTVGALLGAQSPPRPLGSASPVTGLLLKDDVVRALIQESSGDRAHQSVQLLAQWDRDTQSTYSQAAAWVKGRAEAVGLQEVRLEAMAEAPQWRAKRGELRTAAPFASHVTSFDDLPMSLAPGSSSFTGKGLQVVDVGAGASDADFAGKELKGKVALTTGNPAGPVFRRAIMERGAVGLISSWTTPGWNAPHRQEGEFPDQVGWAHFPAGPALPKAWAFLVSARKAQELRRMGALTVDVDIETDTVPGHYDIVSGVIPGATHPEEEVIITSHLDHYRPGSDDNASGSAVSLEMARTMVKLIGEGKLPRPERTLRFLWLPEFEGTLEWFAAHGKEPKKRLANFNFDMLGADLVKVHSSYAINYTPDWQASYINAVAANALDFLNRFNAVAYPVRKDFQVISVNGSHLPFEGRMVRYTRGSDHQVFNDWGVPGIGFLTWPDDAYHTSGDVPANVDPTTLHRSAVAGLLCLVTTGWMDATGAPHLARLVATYGRQRIAADLLAAERRMNASSPEGLPLAHYFANAVAQTAYDRERRALEACDVFAAKPLPAVKSEVQSLAREAVATADRLQDVALLRAGGKAFKPLALGEAERRAKTLVPAWVSGKERTPYWQAASGGGAENKPRVERLRAAIATASQALREQGEGELRIYQFEDALVSYADGHRSLLEIRDAIVAEYGYVLPLAAVEDLFGVFKASGLMRY